MTPPYSRITGTGSYLPPRRVTNDDLAKDLATRGIETSDQWIVERTGIHARHFAAPDVTSSDLGFEAARHALEAAGRKASDVDLIIVATSTPDMVFPSSAAILQNKLGIAGCPAFDVQAVCSGFVYALTVADAMIRTGSARCALVVGAEVFSRILDFNDRTTCVLFGDGAGAVVLEASQEPGILASDLHADGKHVGILCVPGHVSGGNVLGTPLLHMDGQAVFKFAVRVMAEVGTASALRADPVTMATEPIEPTGSVRFRRVRSGSARSPVHPAHDRVDAGDRGDQVGDHPALAHRGDRLQVGE